MNSRIINVWFGVCILKPVYRLCDINNQDQILGCNKRCSIINVFLSVIINCFSV